MCALFIVSCIPSSVRPLSPPERKRKDEPIEVTKAQNKNTELARAPEELTKHAHAPGGQHPRMSVEQTAFVHAPEELMDITELKESFAEERPNDLPDNTKKRYPGFDFDPGTSQQIVITSERIWE